MPAGAESLGTMAGATGLLTPGTPKRSPSLNTQVTPSKHLLVSGPQFPPRTSGCSNHECLRAFRVNLRRRTEKSKDPGPSRLETHQDPQRPAQVHTLWPRQSLVTSGQTLGWAMRLGEASAARLDDSHSEEGAAKLLIGFGKLLSHCRARSSLSAETGGPACQRLRTSPS